MRRDFNNCMESRAIMEHRVLRRCCRNRNRITILMYIFFFLFAVSPFEMALGQAEGVGVRNDAEAYHTIEDLMFSSLYAFHWFGL